MSARAAALDLRVRLLGDPCLWCWEIVDRYRGGVLMQSSWASEWTGYETREEALSAGCGRLAELRCAGAGHARDRRKGESAA
jgi:hypothetical protein